MVAMAGAPAISPRTATTKICVVAVSRLPFSRALSTLAFPRGAQTENAPLKIHLGLVAAVQKRRFVAVAAAKKGAGSFVQKVTARELNEIVMNHRTLPIVVDFYATWCGPCVLMAEQLEDLAIEYAGDVRFLKVDTDEEQVLANQLEIRGLPTLVFINQDSEKPAIRTEGLLPKDDIREIIDKNLKPFS